MALVSVKLDQYLNVAIVRFFQLVPLLLLRY